MVSLAPALTATPAAAAVAPALDRYSGQKPTWKRCAADTPASFQCATVKVPLDYERPSGKQIGIAISRIRTSVTDQRRGVLLFNPGGPGGSGLKDPLVMRDSLPRKVEDRFDLIGFDPRGVGRSTPVNCGLTADEAMRFMRPYKPETFGTDVAWARSVAGKCRANEGGSIRHITTRNTARDMDVIRAVLGERKISYLGVSYGTYLGAVYTQMFPQRSDRFVLDSAIDPKRVWRGMFQVWAEGAEPAFTNWSRWTARRASTYGLGNTPAKVRQTFWDLVAQADRQPVEMAGQLFSGDDIRAHRHVFFDVRQAAETVRNFHRAASRVSAPVSEPAPVDPVDQASIGTTWSVACGDTGNWPKDPEQYRRDAIRDKARYPLFGDFASNILPCAFWGKNAEPATTIDNNVGALILQNEWDSQTPLAAGTGLRRALKGSKLVTVRGGAGHGVYHGFPNACATAVADDYLATGRLPAKDLSCQSAPRSKDAYRTPPGPALPRLPF